MKTLPYGPLQWASLLPGYLAFFDLADLKRRNVFLGHLRGDQEIAEFDAILRQCIGNSELVERYGSDEWFAFLPTHPEKVLTQIIDIFRKRMPIRFGWQCDAVHHTGKTLRTIHTKPMMLQRGVRCAYAAWSDPAQLETVVQKLDERVYQSAVNTFSCIEQRSFVERDFTWKCVSEPYAYLKTYCPFCHREDVNMDDDDYTGQQYGGSGTCKTCQSQLEFKDYVEIG